VGFSRPSRRRVRRNSPHLVQQHRRRREAGQASLMRASQATRRNVLAKVIETRRGVAPQGRTRREGAALAHHGGRRSHSERACDAHAATLPPQALYRMQVTGRWDTAAELAIRRLLHASGLRFIKWTGRSSPGCDGGPAIVDVPTHDLFVGDRCRMGAFRCAAPSIPPFRRASPRHIAHRLSGSSPVGHPSKTF
jgi:hypothetical protein